jgi:hypothetical protein
MGVMRLTGIVCAAVAAAGLGVASASAAEPLFKPANQQTVTGEGGSSLFPGFVETVAECEKTKVISGRISNAVLIGNIVIDYLGCKWIKGEEASGCPASSIGSPEGLILTLTLRAVVGLLLPSKQVGLLFLPQSGLHFVNIAGATSQDGTCSQEFEIGGDVNAVVQPVDLRQPTGKISMTTLRDIDLTQGLGLVSASLFAFSERLGELVQSDMLTFGEATEVT